jgi:aspartate/methionine/tyrosine aminotransferase
MKTLHDALAILVPSPSYKAHRAAMHLVCAEVVRSNPIPPPAVCDAEMLALFAE